MSHPLAIFGDLFPECLKTGLEMVPHSSPLFYYLTVPCRAVPVFFPLQSAADTPMSSDEEDALRQHGLKSSALGDKCPTWLKKFAAMQVNLLQMLAMRLVLMLQTQAARLSKALLYTAEMEGERARNTRQRLHRLHSLHSQNSLVCLLFFLLRTVVVELERL